MKIAIFAKKMSFYSRIGNRNFQNVIFTISSFPKITFLGEMSFCGKMAICLRMSFCLGNWGVNTSANYENVILH